MRGIIRSAGPAGWLAAAPDGGTGGHAGGQFDDVLARFQATAQSCFAFGVRAALRRHVTVTTGP